MIGWWDFWTLVIAMMIVVGFLAVLYEGQRSLQRALIAAERDKEYLRWQRDAQLRLQWIQARIRLGHVGTLGFGYLVAELQTIAKEFKMRGIAGDLEGKGGVRGE